MSLIVAIDGPAGAGKSTIAKKVAEALGLTRVNTGAIYRALTLLALEHGVTDEGAIAGLLPRLTKLRFEGSRVLLEERDISTAIRSPEVTREVSRVSAIGAVRTGLLGMQRTLARAHSKGAVLEGRDIGTVVFPDADVKVFLTASAAARAQRRLKDVDAAQAAMTYDEVLADIERRDAYDKGRAVAPLRAAEDAVEVDSTGKPIPEVVAEIVALVEAHRATVQGGP